MKIRDFTEIGIKLIEGLLSALVTLHAVYAVMSVDFRANPILTLLYCIFPGLVFLIFLFARSLGSAAFLQTILFTGYLVTACMLNWRTCAELGYCSTVAATVLETLKTKPVLASLVVAVLSFVTWRFEGKGASAESQQLSSKSV